jgi:hypothetical protein
MCTLAQALVARTYQPLFLSNNLYYVTLICISLTVHSISIKPVLSDHLSYVTIFHCSPGKSHKTGLTVYGIYIATLMTCPECDYNLNFSLDRSALYGGVPSEHSSGIPSVRLGEIIAVNPNSHDTVKKI